MSNPYRAGSRKAAIYDVFMRDGIDAALEHAASVDIKAATVKSWVGAWGKRPGAPTTKPKENKAPPKTKEAPTKAPKPEPEKKFKHPDTVWRGTFEPHFCYTSRKEADRRLLDLLKAHKMRAGAFHVLEHQGKFAVVPAAYKPQGPIPQFNIGDIVFDVIIPNAKAKVVAAGPEQCVVRYEHDVPHRAREQAIPNVYLYTFEGKKAPSGALKKGKSKPEKRV